MRMNWIHFKSTFLLIKFKLNIFPSSEISIVPLPAGSEFLAIFRVSNVTSSHNTPAEIGERGWEGANFTPPGHWSVRGGKRKQHQQVMSRSELISRC